MGSSSNRLAALTFWIVAASVAIAVLGSSTLLFPGPDIGGRATTPPGKDIVARVVAPLFAPPPVREETPPPPPPPAEPQAVTTGTTPSAVPVAVTATPTAEPKPAQAFSDQPIAEKPGIGTAPKAGRKSTGPGLARANEPEGGHGLARGKGHAGGPVSFEPPRGPKQPHVRQANTHGKSGGRPPAHARTRR